MPDPGWRERIQVLVVFLVIPLFPIVLVQTVLDQQRAPMPGLHVRASIIYQVIPGSGAEESGIRAGDRILRMNGRPFVPEHLSRQIRLMKVGQLLDLELERNGERFQTSVPLVSVGQVTHGRFLLYSSVAFLFWVSSCLLVWRRFPQYEMRLLFLIGQSISLGLLFPYVDVVSWYSTTSWTMAFSALGGLFSTFFLFQFHISFPVKLWTPRQRLRLISGIHGLGLILAVGWIIHNYSLYLPHVLGLLLALYAALLVIAAGIIQGVVYRRFATPDGRRRLRLIMFGELIAGVPPTLLYLGPSAILGYSFIPEWLVLICLLAAPLAYVVATAKGDLFQVDRILNHSMVYAILTLVIIIFFVAPISMVFWLTGSWPGSIFLVAGLLLGALLTFERIRSFLQDMVDRLFYRGWYDYPGVVEKTGDALAGSLEWDSLVNILTAQVPRLMQLHGAYLQVEEQATPELDPTLLPRLRFPLVLENGASGQWIVGPRTDGEDFSAEDRRILRTLAHQVTFAVNNMLLVKKIRDQLAEIQANRELVARIDRKLITTREEERASLSRDLHDGPVQELIGLNMQLGMIEKGGSAGAVDEIREDIKSVIFELRSISAELRPPMLDTMGLGAALRDLAQDWTNQNSIPISLELAPDADLRSLPDPLAVNLYRVAQEALSNISQHAQARQVNLRLACDLEASLLSLTVQDDGIGFVYDPRDLLAADGHLGLADMRERVSLFGGQWRLESFPGQGTTIFAAWPILQPA